MTDIRNPIADSPADAPGSIDRDADVAAPPATAQQLPEGRFHRWKSVLRFGARAVQSSALIVVAVIAWQLVVSIAQPPEYLLPAPAAVWTAMWDAQYQWVDQIVITLQEILGGFAIAAVTGLVLAVAIAWSPMISRFVMPPLVLFNTLPKVAIAPLFIIYLGYGVLPNIVIAALIAFFPIVINTSIGLLQTDQDIVDLGRSLNAPTWKIFVRLRLPSAVPYILSSLKVATTMAVTGAVLGEFIASQKGLGNLIIATQVNLQTEVAFAAVLWLSVIGMALYYGVQLIGRLLFPWASRTVN